MPPCLGRINQYARLVACYQRFPQYELTNLLTQAHQAYQKALMLAQQMQTSLRKSQVFWHVKEPPPQREQQHETELHRSQTP
ncbi:hypothetical protein [Thermosporothrix hazakensis]|nr:hypothetical protein [Thermosporothrix hazakensis]